MSQSLLALFIDNLIFKDNIFLQETIENIQDTTPQVGLDRLDVLLDVTLMKVECLVQHAVEQLLKLGPILLRCGRNCLKP